MRRCMLLLLLLLAGCAGGEATPAAPVEIRLGSVLELLDAGAPPPNVGEQAPNFRFRLDGVEQSLLDLRGKLVLINFWATWCAPCAVEMPELQAVASESADLVLLAINQKETEEVVRSYAAERSLGLTLLVDQPGAISKRYGATNLLPMSYLLDTQGRIAYRQVGPMSATFLRDRLAQTRAP